MMRAITAATVLYPSDAVSAEKLTAEAAKTPGLVYIRTSRPKTKVLYGNDEAFPVGGSKTLRSSAADKATWWRRESPLHEALAAHDTLAKEGVAVRVIDLYSVKPIDAKSPAGSGRRDEAPRDGGGPQRVRRHRRGGGLRGGGPGARRDPGRPRGPALGQAGGAHESPRHRRRGDRGGGQAPPERSLFPTGPPLTLARARLSLWGGEIGHGPRRRRRLSWSLPSTARGQGRDRRREVVLTSPAG